LVQKKSLKDIAKESNVSTAMVSQILNGRGRASVRVRKKVLTMLEENGYRPKYARKPFYFIIDLPRIELSGKTQNVLEQLSGIEQVFEENQLTLHVEFIRAEPSISQLRLIIDQKPSGVFINTDAPFLNEICKLCQQVKIPAIQIGYDTENPGFSAVVMDGFSGAYTATRYLIKKGHERIGILRFIAGISAINSSKKFAGYHAALTDAGFGIDDQLIKELRVVQDEPGWIPARQLVEEMLRIPDPPTAIFVDNSYISLSLLFPLADDKGRVPQSIQNLDMVHFEDWPLQPVHDIITGKLFFPEIDSTFICIDWEEIGRQAANLLIKKVSKYSLVPDILRVNPILYRIKGDIRDPILED
jgi:DNA-binding LacI/PurR family transcriptional regulator